MMDNGLSIADAMAMAKGDNDGFGGSGGWLWFLIVMFALFNGGFNGGNNNTDVLNASMQRGFDNQNVMQRFDAIAQNQNNFAYENANLINKSIYDNAQLINNANVNNMQNIFGVTQAMNSGFNDVNANINNLAHQLEQCCCNLKSQMLQDKYDDVRNQLNLAEIASSNAYQTNNLLRNMGRWYPYAPIYGYGTQIGG